MAKTFIKTFAVLFAFSLIAAACGGDSDETAIENEPEAVEEEVTQVEEDREQGDATGEDTRDDMTAVHGGRLVYGVEADTSNPFVPYAASCAISCRMILRTVSDALFITGAEGNIVPHLVETVAPAADFKSWTMSVRDGIKFHDGTPLDGAAVAYNLNTCRMSPLTGPALSHISDVTSDGQSVTISYTFPEALGPASLNSSTQCGFMFSPTWLQTLASNPLLNDEQRAAATGNPTALVGVGAFTFESYTPGNGNSFIATRNADYWRGENGITGEELPYLDEIEFVVSVDIQGRSNGLKGGQFDIIHTSNADEIKKYEDNENYVLLQANDYGETSMYMLNAAQGTNPYLGTLRGDPELAMDPLGMNSVNPMIHLSCRKAAAHSVDTQRLADERGAGIVKPANGPFPPGSMGYLEDTGYPKFDIAMARAEMEQCKIDSGQDPVTVGVTIGQDPFSAETADLVVSMMDDAFGEDISVVVTPIEQGQLIGLALAGAYHVMGWRNFGGVDPSELWYWWSAYTASPVNPTVPELALNFGRFIDPEMETAMQGVRFNPDPAVREASAEEVSRLFGKNVWNLWTTWTLWGLISSPRVMDITTFTTPEGTMTAPVVAGKHSVQQIWCQDGNCQG